LAMKYIKFLLNIHSGKGRYIEIDALRAFAILLMVFYHFSWDLMYFGYIEIDVYNGFWYWFARFIASLFIFTAGIGIAIAYGRCKDYNDFVKSSIKRGLVIFMWAAIISLVSLFQFGSGYMIIFGILHLLGFSVIASAFAVRINRVIIIAVAVVTVFIGYKLFHMASHDLYLVWAGVQQYGRAMPDYYPVFPYFAPALVGLAVGKTFYSNGMHPDLKFLKKNNAVKLLATMGRFSLLIYLVHQPILMAFFSIVQFFRG